MTSSVYFIGQIADDECKIKIGVSNDRTRRLRNLQTGNPDPLKLMGWIVSDDAYALEKELHKVFFSRKVNGEWFGISAYDIFPILKASLEKGFIAVNTDAFKIIGFDSDGIPEYFEVWDWVDIEYDVCCPFCGCFCGMHFIETANMYYCQNCNELTDFEN